MMKNLKLIIWWRVFFLCDVRSLNLSLERISLKQYTSFKRNI